MAEAKDDFYWGGGYPLDLADGRIIPSGTKVKLTAKEQQEPHNKSHIEENRLQVLEKDKEGGDK